MPQPKEQSKEQVVSQDHKTIVRGTFWGLTGTVALKLLSFIYTIFVARFFAQNDVGTFYLALSIMYSIQIFGDLGISSALGRYVPYYIGKGEKNKAYALLKVSYWWVGILSLALGVILFACSVPIASFFKNPDLVLPLQAMAAFLVFIVMLVINSGFITSLKMIKENNMMLNLQSAIKLALMVILLVLFGANMAVLCVSFVLSYLVATLISFLYVQKGLEKAKIESLHLDLSGQIKLMKEIVPFGITLAIVTTFWSVATYLDRMMIGMLMPSETSTIQIAVYSIAISLATVTSLFPSAVTAIFLPIISEMHGAGKKGESEKLSTDSVRWIIFLTIPLTILFIAFPEDILQMFYGISYSSGALVLVIFSIGMFVRSLSYVHGMILASRRIVRVELIAAIVAIAINACLNWVLIPAYGINGAAIASAVAFLAVTVINVYYCRKIAGFGFSKKFVVPVFAGMLALALLFLLRGSIIDAMALLPKIEFVENSMVNILLQKSIKLAMLGVLFAIATGLYFLFLSLTRSFEAEDSEMVAAICRRASLPESFTKFAKRLMRVKSNA